MGAVRATGLPRQKTTRAAKKKRGTNGFYTSIIAAAMAVGNIASTTLPAVGALAAVAAGTAVVGMVQDVAGSVKTMEQTVMNLGAVTEGAVATATMSGDGTNYLEFVGPGIKSTTQVLQQIENSELFTHLGQMDTRELNRILAKVAAADIGALIDGMTLLIAKLDRLKIHNDVSITTGGDDDDQIYSENRRIAALLRAANSTGSQVPGRPPSGGGG